MAQRSPSAWLLVDETYREAAHGESAEVASVASRHPRVITGASVSKAHGAPGLRVLGVGRVMGGHADFLFDVLSEHARDARFPRVLVSGTADQTMPALVHRAYEEAGAALELTVLDWCETPLALCRWHAERTGRRGCGIEIDPAYVDTAVRRWERLTGRAALHANGKTFTALEKLRSRHGTR